MKKGYKIISGIMFSLSAIVLLFSLGSSIAVSDNWYDDFTFTKDDVNLTITLTKYNGTDTEVYIPSVATIDDNDYSVIVSGKNTTNALFANNGNITKVTFENGVKADDKINYLFYKCSNLTEVVFNNFDTSGTTQMASLFSGCANLSFVDLSKFDTSNVTTMANMFNGCSKLGTLNLQNFNTSNVTSMSGMFNGCSKLGAIDLHNFNTRNVTTMANMFNGCSRIKNLDLSNFNTSNVTTMDKMFYNCTSLQSLNISSFTSESLTTIHDMLYASSSLKKIYLGHFDFLYGDAENSKYAYTFGRGTWKRLEDGKSYPISDIVYDSSFRDISGTYVWESNVINEMFVDYSVTYQIGKMYQIDEYSFSDNSIFVVASNGVFIKNLHATSMSDYVVNGSVTLLFKNVVTDVNHNKYNLRLTIDNIHIYDLNRDFEVDTFNRCLVRVTNSGFLTFSGYNYLDDYSTRISLEQASNFDITLEIVDDNGVAQEGSYVFAAGDIDAPSMKDIRDGTFTHKYSETYGWGQYSEGINLLEGFDDSKIKYYSHTLLTRTGNRIYGTHYDESSEFTEFSIKADAKKTKFTWTGEYCATNVLRYYQPAFVSIIKQNNHGVNLPGAHLELYSGNTLVDSWTSTNEAHTLFLNVGYYTLKETSAPTNYVKANDLNFYVDIDGQIVVNNNNVDSVIFKNPGKDVSVTVKYIDDSTSSELDSITSTKQYGDTFTSEAKNYNGYVLKSRPSSETVTLTENETTLVYHYSKISGGVLEKHINSANGEILYNETHAGNVGDDYNISSKTFDGFDLDNTRLPSNSTGKMKDAITEVIYYYKQRSKVTIKYIDKNTNEPIANEEEINGYVNENYNSQSKDIPQYILIESEGETGGTFGNEEKVIVYYYQRVVYVTTEVVGNVGGTITGNETVYYQGDSTPDNIVIEADEDHYINRITVNGEEVAVTDDNRMVLPNFLNMEENKHVVIEFNALVKNIPKTDMSSILPYISIGLLLLGLLCIYLGKRKKRLVPID